MKKRFGKRFITFMLFLVLTIMIGVFPACAPSSTTNTGTDPDAPDGEPSEKTGPKYIAHKGYSSHYLGNTEASFVAAANRGFYGIETDIRKTKDGYFVCNHDATVVYDNGSELKISNNYLDTLTSSPLRNDKTEEVEYLCTFETYLRACKEGNKVAVIELKDYFGKSDIQRILNIIDEEYDREKVSFITFIYALLPIVRHEDPDIHLQYLTQTEGDPNIDLCLNAGISIDIKYTILTEEIVNDFHEAGLTVNAWTVNDNTTLRKVKRLGVDYVTTDVFYGD